MPSPLPILFVVTVVIQSHKEVTTLYLTNYDEFTKYSPNPKNPAVFCVVYLLGWMCGLKKDDSVVYEPSVFS